MRESQQGLKHIWRRLSHVYNVVLAVAHLESCYELTQQICKQRIAVLNQHLERDIL